ncbi:MAG: hypothetical protein Q7S40_03235 [Opitutaceae bacterium]|nr:hypothetical protein [Opitutaceae bacterium]
MNTGENRISLSVPCGLGCEHAQRLAAFYSAHVSSASNSGQPVEAACDHTFVRISYPSILCCLLAAYLEHNWRMGYGCVRNPPADRQKISWNAKPVLTVGFGVLDRGEPSTQHIKLLLNPGTHQPLFQRCFFPKPIPGLI